MGEKKIFDEGGFVVTTERFVWPGGQLPIESLKGASAFVDYGWQGALIIAGIGLIVMTSADSLFWTLGGLLIAAVGAPVFFKTTITRKLLVLMDGEGPDIGFSDTDFLKRVVEAIDKAVSIHRTEHAQALRNELDGIDEI